MAVLNILARTHKRPPRRDSTREGDGDPGLNLSGTWPDEMPADPCIASAGVLGVPTRCSWEHMLRAQASRG